jgi:hypothetical protein
LNICSLINDAVSNTDYDQVYILSNDSLRLSLNNELKRARNEAWCDARYDPTIRPEVLSKENNLSIPLMVLPRFKHSACGTQIKGATVWLSLFGASIHTVRLAEFIYL